MFDLVSIHSRSLFFSNNPSFNFWNFDFFNFTQKKKPYIFCKAFLLGVNLLSHSCIFNRVGKHMFVIIKISLRGWDVFMISQFLHQTDIHAGIYQFWYKQMSAEVTCSFYAEFAINGTKQTADTHAIVVFVLLLRCK